MKKIYISTIAAALLSTGALADSSSVKEAFANGKVSGDITLFGESINNSGSTKDARYTMGSVGVSYETDSISGFKGAIGFRANHKISENEDSVYDESKPKSVFDTANVSYSTDKATIIVGRQAIDLEWMGDYHEAVVAALTYVPDTTIVLGHTQRFMEADADAALNEMGDIGKDGANVIDVKYTGIKGTTINPYFMDAKDLFSAYGLKVTSGISGIDLTAHYAGTSEDDATKKDGSIAHLEVGTTVSDITLAAGYITTDKQGGAQSLTTLGENIDPFENGGATYAADSDTYYVSAAAEISSVSLSAFYGSSTYGSTTDSEIILTAGTTVAENLSLNLLVASTNNEDSTTDKDEVSLTVAYSF